MLVELKAQNHSTMHNKTDVDSCQRAIRAIEIETYNLEHPGVLFAEVVLLFVVDILHEKKINVLDWLDLQAKWFRWTIYVSMSLFIIIGMIRDYGESASTFIYANF